MVEGKLERRDITNDYATYQSEAYAPLTRHGVFMDKGSEQFMVKSKYLSTYRGKDEMSCLCKLMIIKTAHQNHFRFCNIM